VGGDALRARGIWAALAAVALVATLGLTGSAGGQAPTEVEVSWDVAQAGFDGESVEVFVAHGGCVGLPFRPVVEETATSVRITMFATSVAGPDVVCTQEIRRGLARVVLSGPLDGRSIRGRHEPTGITLTSFVDKPGAKRRRVRVPNLVGLSAFEARRALRLRGLRVRVRSSHGHGGRSQIRGQAPQGGRPIAPGGVVRILVGLP
jgi:hypothetical protein